MRQLLLTFLFMVTMRPAWGHPMPNSAVVLRLQRTAIDAELTLPISELALGWEQPLPRDAVRTVQEYGAALKDYVRAHVRATAPDGRSWTVMVRDVTPVVEKNPDVQVALTLTPPPGAPVDRLTLHYDVIFHHLITHTALVTLAGDWRGGGAGEKPMLLGTLRDTDSTLVIDRSQDSQSQVSPWQGFAAMFRLGVGHIAGGTDHLLFLLALLLPAPLVVVGGRWGGYHRWEMAIRRIIKVVTSFTLGHSITLVLGALGWARLPPAVTESAIALSILVSAIHALVPIFRGKEVYIAGGFGLVHGLSFAATLTVFGFDPVTLASSVLGFNLGIEAFQLLIILATMPWLVLLARSPIYEPFRIVCATGTGIAAAAWFGERALGWPNPVGPLVENLAAHALWLLVGLIALAVGVTVADKVDNERRLEARHTW